MFVHTVIMVIEPHMKQGRQHKLISTIFLATSVTKKLDHNSLSGAGSLGTLLAAGKGENLSGEDWSNMVQILRLQMMMNMGKDTGTLI